MIDTSKFTIEEVNEADIELSSKESHIIVGEYGDFNCYRSIKGGDTVSSKLKSMWNEIVSIINEHGLDINFEDNFTISIGAYDAPMIYYMIKQQINDFCKSIFNNFSMWEKLDNDHVTCIVRPMPETINRV